MVQNPAARLLTRFSRMTHITPILSSLHWLPIKFRIHFKVLVFTYRASDLLHPYITSRSSDQGLLVVPRLIIPVLLFKLAFFLPHAL